MTTCVRRFGRQSRAPGERRGREHITGARMPSSNGHEVKGVILCLVLLLTRPPMKQILLCEIQVLLRKLIVVDAVAAYSSDAVYLYSTYDVPETDRVIRTPILSPNKQKEASNIPTVVETEPTIDISSMDVDTAVHDVERSLRVALEQLLEYETPELSDEGEDGESGGEGLDFDTHSDVPVVLPRSRFMGHCNVATVKDGQFYSTEQ